MEYLSAFKTMTAKLSNHTGENKQRIIQTRQVLAEQAINKL